jgi:uncharacterized membrane protein
MRRILWSTVFLLAITAAAPGRMTAPFTPLAFSTALQAQAQPSQPSAEPSQPPAPAQASPAQQQQAQPAPQQQQASPSPSQQRDQVDITLNQPGQNGMWYRSPLWIAVFAMGLVLFAVVIILMVRGGGGSSTAIRSER